MRTFIFTLLLAASLTASAQYTHKDRMGLVAPMNSYKLMKTGIRFESGPIWWNPIHEIETPKEDWKIEYNFVLKWIYKDGSSKSTTIKTWEPYTFWQGEANVEFIHCNVIAIPHHKYGQFSSNDSFGCSYGISLKYYPFEL